MPGGGRGAGGGGAGRGGERAGRGGRRGQSGRGQGRGCGAAADNVNRPARGEKERYPSPTDSVPGKDPEKTVPETTEASDKEDVLRELLAESQRLEQQLSSLRARIAELQQQGKAIVACVNESLCTSCGACIPFCPNDAITMGTHAAQINQALCTGCQACVSPCPAHAISMIEA